MMQKQDDVIINFYSTKGPFGCFSNFSQHAVTISGKRFPTTEHYFQAMKFVSSTKDFEEIRHMKSAMSAAKAGRDRSRPLRSDWEKVKDQIMHDAVFAKFTQHPALTETLLGTGDATLVEHTKNDRYWGDGGDGSGKNMLGKTLMAVRTEILLQKNSGDATTNTAKRSAGDDADGDELSAKRKRAEKSTSSPGSAAS